MMKPFLDRCSDLFAKLALIVICLFSNLQPVHATDYFLTMGGGYEPEGNQASLEANVLFYQNILMTRHHGDRFHNLYFADGLDPQADLQVLADKPAKSVTPATDLIASLHRQYSDQAVAYRNHRVPDIAGALDPALVRGLFDRLARRMRAGDRLIVYVTAHGSEGPERDPFNTTIDCWNDKEIHAREFTEWLGKLPPEVPVVMVMAQCYCGGFGHTIFQGLDEKKGPAPQLRAGFFAQQYNLPAAGCRPDIEHDEEFSSYFWGAIAGRSRNGVPITGCDIDGNGVVSFSEAYAYAVAAGETIDIPLCTSEVWLRTYSRLTPKPKSPPPKSDDDDDDAPETDTKSTTDAPAEENAPALATMNGTLQSFVDRGRPMSGRIVMRLSTTLGFKPADDVTTVLSAAEQHRRAGRFQGRGRGRSARRDLLAEVTDKWPDLGDEKKWHESQLLSLDNQQKLLAELQHLPSWKAYQERQQQRETTGKQAEVHELRSVKFRRLMNSLESIVLEQNLPRVATPEIVSRYRQLVDLEDSTLEPGQLRR